MPFPLIGLCTVCLIRKMCPKFYEMVNQMGVEKVAWMLFVCDK